MQVILLEDVKGVGNKGQIINASDGHAKNFLFPRNLAAPATKSNLASLDAKQKKAEHKINQEIAAANAIAARFKKLRIVVRVGESGKMFGSVSNKEISDAFQKQLGIAVDRKKIVVEPVKTVGEYTATVKLHPKVSAKVEFEVVAE